MKKISPWILATTSIVGLSVIGSAVSAQSLEEIVVSARKVEERLQDAPVTVSALGREALDMRGIDDVSDLSAMVPGLSYEQDFGRRLDRPAIRGQSSILGTPNAASFIDGVFIPDSLFGSELAFVERVEVIKGPQSALYGRQTFAGAISYVSKKPNMREFEGKAKVSVGTDSELDVLGIISGPIVEDKVGFQLGASYYTFGGQYRNNNVDDAYYGKKIGDEETKAINGMLYFTPNDNLDIALRYAYGEFDDGQEATGFMSSAYNNCFPTGAGVNRYYCGKVIADPNSIVLDLDDVNGGRLLRETHRASAVINYDFNNYTLTAIGGYNSSKMDRHADADYQRGAVGGGRLHYYDFDHVESLSGELRIASPQQERFRWLAGTYYYHEDRDTGRLIYTDGSFQDNGRNTVRNIAGFAMAQFDFTDRFSGSAEIRYAEDKLGLVGGDNNYDLSITYKSWNPRFTLDFKVTDDVMIYGVVARGNKPGGFNSDARLTGDQVAYDEEGAWNYELGIKTEMFNRRLRFNASAYYIDWTGQQLTNVATWVNPVTSVISSISYIANMGSLDVKGIEGEVQAVVTPWWTLELSGSINKAKYTEGFDSTLVPLVGSGDLKGKYAPNTPKYQYAIINTFQTEIGNGYEAFGNVSYTYRSGKFDQLGNFATTGARHHVNARAGIANETYTASLYVKNLFNSMAPLGVTRYIDAANANARAFLVGLPRERQFGITLEAKF